MRTGMWGEARARALGAAAVAAMLVLGGCGGGSDTPALEVAVKVDGVADASNPLTAGESTTISVPSGTTLSFASDGETRWSPTATDSSYEVNSFSYTAKSMTVSSNGGGTLVVVFTNKANEAQKATLTVEVAPREFERVATVDGETSDWTYVNVNRADEVVTSEVRTLVALAADTGNYGTSVENLSATNLLFATTNYDSSDRAVGTSTGTTECTDDAPIVQFSYPLHVGKSWSGTSSRMCSGGKAFDQTYVRTVEA
ncbi:hypothetical protein, partial [Ideonella sp.]|uniref:hypothetical protein n=1 Tax=Ideonella sp. TaxID=1929293 RepID=UPI002B45A1D2